MNKINKTFLLSIIIAIIINYIIFNPKKPFLIFYFLFITIILHFIYYLIKIKNLHLKKN